MDEARSGSKSSLLEFASLSSHEVPTERSEGEARSSTNESLLSITNEWLKARVFDEVPKRLQGARSTKLNNDVRAQSL